MTYITRYYQATLSLILSLILLLFSTQSLAANSAGELTLIDRQGKQQTALLLNTAITGEVNGMLANITVAQTFKNNSDSWLNGRYAFPLPEGSSVDSLTIEIGERVITGVIKEKEDAKRTFRQAKRQGKKAALLQQHRPNLFSIAVANIGPSEQVLVTITFIDKVAYRNDVFSLRLPTTLTPRYIPNASPTLNKLQQQQLEDDLRSSANVEINSTHGWASNNSSVVDANDITPPQIHGVASQASHRFSLDLSLKPGLNLQRVSSPSHPIASNFSSSSSNVQVSLANGHEPMDSDLQLEWQPIIGTAPKAALFEQNLGSDFYTMLMVTPPKTSTSISLPRDVTFIVDSSGSMAGEPMRQAKQALLDGLNYLNAGDRFNIVDFDSNYRTLYSHSQPADFDHLRDAKTMINNLRADGGTEMSGALRFALNTNRDSSYLSQVIFITDGAIGNEAELFKLISRDLKNARLFTVGIGSAPNSFFMSKAAKFGRGSYTYISDLNHVNTKMANLFEKITKPLLRDLRIEWPTEVEQYPERLPDLYAGEPLTVLVKSSSRIDKVKLRGSMLNTPWSQTLSQAATLKANEKDLSSTNLDTVWARQKIANLMDSLNTGEQTLEHVKPIVTQLGIAHHILTKFTAFVAVEKTLSKPEFEKAKQKSVPNLMPKGSAMAIPQTASPATLFSVLGILMMFVSFVTKTLIKRRAFSSLKTTKTKHEQNHQSDIKEKGAKKA